MAYWAVWCVNDRCVIFLFNFSIMFGISGCEHRCNIVRAGGATRGVTRRARARGGVGHVVYLMVSWVDVAFVAWFLRRLSGVCVCCRASTVSTPPSPPPST